MSRPAFTGSSDHRGPLRHEGLMPSHNGDDEDGGWMIGYLDVMTLLVALLVLIFTLSLAEGEGGPARAVRGETPVSIPQGVPLPTALAKVLDARPAHIGEHAGRLAPSAVSAALGVAGLPQRPSRHQASPHRSLMPTPLTPPTPLRLLASAPVETLLPRPLVPMDTAPEAPLADFMLVLTDRPPQGVREISPEAVSGAVAVESALRDRLATAPYLPDLEGVAVSRVAEGIKLRVEDQWLFPTAEAELTAEGQALVRRMVDIIQRHDGEVAVEGHTDSRAIRTEAFPSNWVLSSARAIAIVHALEEAGVDSRRLRAVGLADTRPLADNATAEGRARNRRVEVIIHAR
ncbi:flagellar motor protein MotB [Billgrantia azerbaijanica]|nr:flagellar motor protein MotB [Halomonas azerbaijanica]